MIAGVTGPTATEGAIVVAARMVVVMMMVAVAVVAFRQAKAARAAGQQVEWMS